jgi:hypothetical protein
MTDAGPTPEAPPTPWARHPSLPRGGAWYAGEPGEHFVRFFLFFSAMSPDEQAAFERAHPEPPQWRGFYEMIRTTALNRSRTPDSDTGASR